VRIAVLHSRYLSGVSSGENRAVEDDVELLTQAGHAVTSWTPTPKTTIRGQAQAGVEVIWSADAVRRVREFVSDWGADIVHFHNLFPLLSPAAIRAAATEGVGVVMTLHNYRLMCLPASYYRGDSWCEDCLGHLPWRGIAHRCYRGSALASAALAASLATHRWLRTFEQVNLFLAVSNFVRDKHIDAGIPPGRLRITPQFAWPTQAREGPGDYFLYLGRLVQNKGAETLMRAWSEEFGRLVVVGDGPLMPDLRAMASSSVEFLGALPREAVPEVLRRARALLVPSLVYDAAPRAVPEACSAGVPVLASRVGGLPEAVADGESGILVRPGAVGEWAAAIGRLTDDGEAMRLGAGALQVWEQKQRPEHSLARLESAYEAARAAAVP
jgi:glycosyltransferase involved in cell wall biosynthesis